MPVNVLIVEDNPRARTALEKLLAREGFHIEWAGTVQRGKELLDGQAAIILDLRLAGREWHRVAQRKIRTGNTTKALIVTACDDPAVLDEVRML